MENANYSSNLISEFLTNKRWAFFRHLILIIIIALNFNLLSPGFIELYAKELNIPFNVFYVGNLISMGFSTILIYFNLYILFPKYLIKKNYLYYIVGVICLLLILFAISIVIQQVYINYFGKKEDFATRISVFGFLETTMYPFVFLSATTGYKIFKTWVADQQRFAELQKESIKTELSQLKNQVNPHFLFNTLNNLHVLTKTNPDKASEIILGLSDVLRYQIYDSRQDKVLLNKDIEVIRQYLDLEKIRRDQLWINLTIHGETAGILVPPLLFINFIDNAIKHSHTRRESSISISFEVISNRLNFEISNSKSAVLPTDENNGFGLANIKKRLDLLYGTQHTLKIIDDADRFTVKLTFPI